jgi:hypothetical protein
MKKYFKQRQPHIDLRGAMESGDHSKNGASPKSWINKRLCMIISFILCFLSVSVVNGQSKEDFESWINNATKRENGQYYYRFKYKFVIDSKKLIRFFSESPNLVLSNYNTATDTYYPPVWDASKVEKKTYVSDFTFMYVKGDQTGLLSKNKKDGMAKAIEAGIEQGKINITYIAYVLRNKSVLDDRKFEIYRQEKKLKKWFSKHPQFIRKKTEHESNSAKIYFIKTEEEAEYNKANEKQIAFQNANTIEEKIAVRRRYPDYDPGITLAIDVMIKDKDKELAKKFLLAFPEKSSSLKNNYLGYMKQNSNKILDITNFIYIFDDYQAIENRVYSTIVELGKRISHEWVKEVIPLLSEHVDITRILSVAIDHKNDSESTLITKYIDYTGTKYFSKKSLNEYFASTATYLQLLKEINNCTPLMQQRPKIAEAEDLFQLFVDYRLDKEGATVWRQFFSDFPDKKPKILSTVRNRYVSSTYYYERKWSSEIGDAISNANTVRGNLNKYISSEIPDSEGIRLAKQYLTEANSVINKYNADLPKAQSYESGIKSQISRIKAEVSNTTIVPPYRVKNRKARELSESIDIYIPSIDADIAADYSYEDRVYYGPYWGSAIGKSDNVRTLDEYVLKFVKDRINVIIWDYDWDTDRLKRAESIIRQYNQYGIREWYKIDY